MFGDGFSPQEAHRQAVRIVDSEKWDYIIPIILGGILWSWKQDIIAFWKLNIPPQPVCIPLGEIVSGINWSGGAFVFAITAFFVYCIQGSRRRVLRSVKIAAFLGICVLVATGYGYDASVASVFPSEPLELLFNSVMKAIWFAFTAGYGFIFALLLLIGMGDLLLKAFGKSRGLWWKLFLLFANMFSFVELMFASDLVKRWTEVTTLASFGALAAAGEAIVFMNEAMPIEDESPFERRVTNAIVIFGILVTFTVVGIASWNMFLAQWVEFVSIC